MRKAPLSLLRSNGEPERLGVTIRSSTLLLLHKLKSIGRRAPMSSCSYILLSWAGGPLLSAQLRKKVEPGVRHACRALSSDV